MLLLLIFFSTWLGGLLSNYNITFAVKYRTSNVFILARPFKEFVYNYIYPKSSLIKQSTFGDATTGLPAKLSLRNER